MRLTAFAAALALVATGVQAHSWYDHNCCNLLDCYPMGADEREPAPVATPGGWKLFDGTVVPFEDARISQDGRFHVCRYGGSPNLPMVSRAGDPACLYVPAQGA